MRLALALLLALCLFVSSASLAQLPKFDVAISPTFVSAVNAPGPAILRAPFSSDSYSFSKAPNAYLRVLRTGFSDVAVINDAGRASTASTAEVSYKGAFLRVREGDILPEQGLVATVRAYIDNNKIAKTRDHSSLYLIIQIFKIESSGKQATPDFIRAFGIDGSVPSWFTGLDPTIGRFQDAARGMVLLDRGQAVFDLTNPAFSGTHTYQSVSGLGSGFVKPGIYYVQASLYARAGDFGGGLTAVQVGITQLALEVGETSVPGL